MFAAMKEWGCPLDYYQRVLFLSKDNACVRMKTMDVGSETVALS